MAENTQEQNNIDTQSSIVTSYTAQNLSDDLMQGNPSNESRLQYINERLAFLERYTEDTRVLIVSINDRLGNLDSLDTQSKNNLISAVNELFNKFETFRAHFNFDVNDIIDDELILGRFTDFDLAKRVNKIIGDNHKINNLLKEFILFKDEFLSKVNFFLQTLEEHKINITNNTQVNETQTEAIKNLQFALGNFVDLTNEQEITGKKIFSQIVVPYPANENEATNAEYVINYVRKQINLFVGDITTLSTENKNNLTSAINEVLTQLTNDLNLYKEEVNLRVINSLIDEKINPILLSIQTFETTLNYIQNLIETNKETLTNLSIETAENTRDILELKENIPQNYLSKEDAENLFLKKQDYNLNLNNTNNEINLENYYNKEEIEEKLSNKVTNENFEEYKNQVNELLENRGNVEIVEGTIGGTIDETTLGNFVNQKEFKKLSNKIDEYMARVMPTNLNQEFDINNENFELVYDFQDDINKAFWAIIKAQGTSSEPFILKYMTKIGDFYEEEVNNYIARQITADEMDIALYIKGSCKVTINIFRIL